MACEKCGYVDKKEVKILNRPLCQICSQFAPEDKEFLEDYIQEKVDWKEIDTFRKFKTRKGFKQKEGMSKSASSGKVVSRAPLGYDIIQGKLIQNKDASKIHSLFRTFLNRNYSLNSLAKNFGLSVNGVKKILTNRTYLGEIKFDGKIHKADHEPIISAEIFYAVQRKLEDYLKPRK